MAAIGHGRRNRLFARALALAAGALLALGLAPQRAAAQLSEQVLYSFCPQGGNCVDGALPEAGLLMDAAGNLYGTTVEFGFVFEGFGAVFELTPDPTGTGWTETVLHAFGCIDMCNGPPSPAGGVVMDAAGNLYGTTLGGGQTIYEGLLYKLSPDPSGRWNYTLLYGFCSQPGCPDGANPDAGLIIDAAGNLYGTTLYGGAANEGVVFEVAPDGTETVLHSFQGSPADGANPEAGLIMDPAGNLYGTTYKGGAANQGVVFMVAPDGTETVLYSFCAQPGCADGANPHAGLIMDAAGNLYGTTYVGGVFNQGVLFEVAPDGTETVLASGGPYAANPAAGLVMDAAGNLYGTTENGGPSNEGVVGKLAPDGTGTVLYGFSGADGAHPLGGLIIDAAGKLYGTTVQGGTGNRGVVFALTPAPAGATLAPPQRR